MQNVKSWEVIGAHFYLLSQNPKFIPTYALLAFRFEFGTLQGTEKNVVLEHAVGEPWWAAVIHGLILLYRIGGFDCPAADLVSDAQELSHSRGLNRFAIN